MEELSLYKYMTRTLATSKGHLDQERQGLQYTKSRAFDFILQQELSKDIKDDHFPVQHNKTNDCAALIMPYSQTNKAYSDLIGRFPH